MSWYDLCWLIIFAIHIHIKNLNLLLWNDSEDKIEKNFNYSYGVNLDAAAVIITERKYMNMNRANGFLSMNDWKKTSALKE